jgi:hypothetical protein
MTDEAAVLLRISVFGLVAGVVYWLVGYEPLGTVGFLPPGAGPGFAGLYLLRHQVRPPSGAHPGRHGAGVRVLGAAVCRRHRPAGRGRLAAVNREQRHGRLQRLGPDDAG